MMNTNIFLCYTEYHLMLSIAIAKASTNDARNLIYISRNPRIGETVIQNAHTLNDQNIEIRVYEETSPIKALIAVTEQVDKFFVFQEGGLNNLYLMDYFRKRGATVALCQDGAKPYAVWNKEKLTLVVFRDTLKLYQEAFQRRLYLSKLTVVNQYRYAYSPFVDELWLSHPEAFKSKRTFILYKIPPFSEELMAIFDRLFGMSDAVFRPKENSIFYIDQRFTDTTNYNRNIELVTSLRKKFPSYPMYIKLHTNSSKEQTDLYASIEDTHVITEKIPAELFLARLKNSVVIGGHSTAMFFFKESNRYYYISKLFIKDRLFSQMEPGNPTQHIVEVRSIEEIV